jgi:uncharacterized repeat protein (TIGR01451 family)
MRCDFDNLAPDTWATLDLSLVAGTRGTWPLATEVSAWELEPEPADNLTDVIIEAIPHADVSLALAARNTSVEVGEILEIDYEVSNSGPQTAEGIVVTLTIPSHAAMSVSSRCQQAGDMLTCEVPDLPIEEQWKDTVVLHAMSAGTAWITATAGSEENDPDPKNNTDSTGVFIETEKSELVAITSGGGATGVILPILLLLCLAPRLRHPCSLSLVSRT